MEVGERGYYHNSDWLTYESPSIIPLQVAHSNDPATELSLGEPMGVIPAGTLLKTEFSTVVPDATTQGKISVSEGSIYHTV